LGIIQPFGSPHLAGLEADRFMGVFSRIGRQAIFQPRVLALGAVFGAIGIVAAGTAFRLHTWSSIYQYPVHESYTYRWQPGTAQVVPFEIGTDGFAWPVDVPQADTALLAMDLESTLIGRLSDPYVSIAAVPNGLERGAAGRRLLNASHLVQQGIESGRWVPMDGYGAEWDSRAAELLLFDNPPVGNRRILVVAAHPDDAEIAAFGLYKDRDAYVVTVTAGDAGSRSYGDVFPDDAEHFYVKGRLRVWNSITVPMLGGISPDRTANLGYFDFTLERMYAERPASVSPIYASIESPEVYRRLNQSTLVPSACPEATWSALVADLSSVLERVQPDLIVTAHPLLDRHPDHVYATYALFEAMARMAYTHGELYLYTNHCTFNEIYPYGPAYTPVSPPPFFGDTVLCERVVSIPLDEDTQQMKVMALEAMNDLRPLPPDVAPIRGASLGDALWDRLRSVKRHVVDTLRDIDVDHDRYFRRAIRSNELFFVIPADKIAEYCMMWDTPVHVTHRRATVPAAVGEAGLEATALGMAQ